MANLRKLLLESTGTATQAIKKELGLLFTRITSGSDENNGQLQYL